MGVLTGDFFSAWTKLLIHIFIFLIAIDLLSLTATGADETKNGLWLI